MLAMDINMCLQHIAHLALLVIIRILITSKSTQCINHPRLRRGRGGTRKHCSILTITGNRPGVHHRQNHPRPPTTLTKINTENRLKIGLLNTQSCRNKAVEISELIKEESTDVLCLVESWLKVNGDEAIIGDLTPPGYEMESFPRKTEAERALPYYTEKTKALT